jgi:hypothetical protein
MTKQNRMQFLQNLETERKSTLLSYVTGDRPTTSTVGLSTQIVADSVRYFKELVEGLGMQDKIDLFIYSRGGLITAPSTILHLLRKHCKKLSVLVPYKAHSAATLISLGADEIVMGEMGQLSPIDPTTFNVFNPVDPLNPAGRWQISVEDVTAYLSLAKEKAGLDSEESAQAVFRLLADKVHPIALGNVHRIYNLIRLLAPKMLGMHMDSKSVQEQAKIKLIVDTLTERLYTHDYLISCEEAKEIGLKIVDPDASLDKLMWDLYKEYEGDLKLLDLFNPSSIIQNNAVTSFSEHVGYIESAKKTYAALIEGEIHPPPTVQQLMAAFPQVPFQQLAAHVYQLLQQMPVMQPSVVLKTQKWLSI